MADKLAATIHPRTVRGWVVECAECQDVSLFASLFRDVADRFADNHAQTNDHTTTVLEVKP